MVSHKTWLAFAVAFAVLATACIAQFGGGRGGGRQQQPDVRDVPTWENDPDFLHDVFTFVRIQYDSRGGYGRGRGGARWNNDHPYSDLNFSLRLQQLTSLNVNPDGLVLRLTDPRIHDFPFLYMNGVGSLYFSQDEVMALRHYLHNGGFLMLDDFWGDAEWKAVSEQLARAVPEWKPQVLPLSHDIFHSVYDLKQLPQVPGLRHWKTGRTYEDHGPGSDSGPDYRGIFDNHGRLAVLLCHNNDLGDGWEREAEDPEYFRDFAVKWSYPMGMNIVFYVMTH